MSRLSARRLAYLNSNVSFDEIVARVAEEAHNIEVWIRGLLRPLAGVPREARQVIFRIRVCDEVCDLLYNAPDGLRGRYWQSPDHGFWATRQLIGTLSSALLSHSDEHPPNANGEAAPMDAGDIRTSLEAPSAKIWPREVDGPKWLFVEQPLVVMRWKENEAKSPNGTNWCETPTVPELEIKGAILGQDRTEYLPPDKRDRSCQIHRFGFT